MAKGRRVIPQSVKDRIAILGQTKSLRDIEKALLAEGTPVTKDAINRILKSMGVVKRNDAKTIAARTTETLEDMDERIGEAEVSQDMQALDMIERQLNQWRCDLDQFGNPMAPLDIKDKLQVIDRLIKVHETRLKYNPASPGNKAASAIGSFAELMASAAAGEAKAEMKLAAAVAIQAGSQVLEEVIDAEVETVGDTEAEGEEPRTATP